MPIIEEEFELVALYIKDAIAFSCMDPQRPAPARTRNQTTKSLQSAAPMNQQEEKLRWVNYLNLVIVYSARFAKPTCTTKARPLTTALT
jgi:hypothetical protein